MIPKKIHYCWFGRKEKPKLAQKCIASWKKYMPDYEVIEWNEDNFDVNMNAYVRFCFENKKWAFLSDYVRLWVVAQYGGIYFDTDVEAIRSFDDLLQYDAFFCFETDDYIASGLGFGAAAHHFSIEAMLHEYEKMTTMSSVQLIGCPALNTAALLPFGLIRNGQRQHINGIEILPSEYLNPYDSATGILKKTENTHSVHWYTMSAASKSAIIRSHITRPFHRMFGKDCFEKFKAVLSPQKHR